MAWSDPKTYTVGEVLTAATMNEEVRDNLAALRMGQRMVQRDYTTTQAYGSAGAWVTGTLNDTNVSDWAGAGVANRITIVDAGTFALFWTVAPSGQSGSGGNGGRVVHKDSGDVILNFEALGYAPFINVPYSGAGIAVADAGDYFEIQAMQNATGAGGSFQVFVMTVQQIKGG